MSYRMILKPSAVKQMDQLPASARRRVVDTLESVSDDPRPAGGRKLHGADDLWRIRVGPYRVIYTIHDDALYVLVVRVAHRRDAYRS